MGFAAKGIRTMSSCVGNAEERCFECSSHVSSLKRWVWGWTLHCSSNNCGTFSCDWVSLKLDQTMNIDAENDPCEHHMLKTNSIRTLNCVLADISILFATWTNRWPRRLNGEVHKRHIFEWNEHGSLPRVTNLLHNDGYGWNAAFILIGTILKRYITFRSAIIRLRLTPRSRKFTVFVVQKDWCDLKRLRMRERHCLNCSR